MEKIESFITNGGKLQVGWGHKGDIKNANLNGNLTSKGLVDWYKYELWRYGKVAEFYDFKKRHNDHVILKILGTHEKYLICDDKYALITSHNFLTSGINKPHDDLEIGIKITNKRIIRQLLDNFNQRDSLDQHQEAALKKAEKDFWDRCGC